MRVVAVVKDVEGNLRCVTCRDTRKLEMKLEGIDEKVVSAMFTNNLMVFQKSLVKARTVVLLDYIRECAEKDWIGQDNPYMRTLYRLLGISVDQYLSMCRENGETPMQLNRVQQHAYDGFKRSLERA